LEGEGGEEGREPLFGEGGAYFKFRPVCFGIRVLHLKVLSFGEGKNLNERH